MPSDSAVSQDAARLRNIRVMPMQQLAEAVDREDDWTGLTDAAERRRRQNRLNVRAYRRRKALQSKQDVPSKLCAEEEEPTITCWIENEQRVSLVPASATKQFINSENTIIPRDSSRNSSTDGTKSDRTGIIFPLSSDHLILLLQYNVLRASITNRRIVSCLFPHPTNECSEAALHVLPCLPYPHVLPSSLVPTTLQQTIPHEEWVDIIPHPGWRDNVLLALGNFDEDDLWADVMGGLFEGFPQSETERRGVIAWSPPWDVSGWEISEGFWKKWKWAFKGCQDILDSTNKWRRLRGERPLILEV